MDFLDPKKKRAHQRRLFIGYGLMAVLLGLTTYFLVYAANGYGFDRKTGQIIQNGLLIVDAHPESAGITINGQHRGTTNSRLELPEGQYNVQLHRTGYRSWNHKFNLEGGSIEQLVYPFLFPEKLVTKSIQEYTAAPIMSSESPDRHWLVVQPPGSTNTFNVIDLSNNKHVSTAITLPTDTFTAASGDHVYQAVEWSTDNNHLLLKHIFTGGSEYIMLNRDDPTSSVNINKTFPSQVFTTISLRDKKPDQFYLLDSTTGSLLQADSKAKTITPITTGVLSYKTYQADTILYVINPTKSTTAVEVHIRQGSQDYLLRTLPISPTYLLEMASFNSRFYIASGSTADGKTYIYENPFDDLGHHPARTPQPLRVLIVSGSQYVSFSAIARFIAVQGGSSFAVYDAETGRQFRYDTKLSLAPGQKATWMDGHRLTLVSDGKLNIFDFDGTNMQTLSASLPAFEPIFDRDYTALFTVAPQPSSPDKAEIMRTELKVLPAGATNQ